MTRTFAHSAHDHQPRPPTGAPVDLRIFFPSLDGSVETAPLLEGCGRYPLIPFAHGHCIGGVDHLVVGTPDRSAESDALGCGKAETDSSRSDKMNHGRMPSERVVRTEGVC